MSITKSQSPDNLDPGSIDNEHRVQMGLLDALYDAVSNNQPAAEVDEILNQLTAYSELHFMSEQLLMRLYAYPDYDDHVNDHEALTQYLNQIMKSLTTRQHRMALETASEMRQFLTSHISTRDEAFLEFLKKLQT